RYSHSWIQRSIWILENHLHVLVEFFQLHRRFIFMNPVTFKNDFSIRCLIKSHNGSSSSRFTTSGFTNKSKGFSFINIKFNAIYCFYYFIKTDFKMFFYLFYFNQFLLTHYSVPPASTFSGGSTFGARSSCSQQAALCVSVISV